MHPARPPWLRNPDADRRARERALLSDPAMANRVVADKLRSGRAGEITLAELANANANEILSNIPPGLVRGAVRAFASPRKGIFYGGPIYHGLIDAFLEDSVRVATPAIVARMVELSDRDQILLDLWIPMWTYLKPSAVVRRRGGPMVRVTEPSGWLDEELRATVGDIDHPTVINVEDAGGGEPVEDLVGYWICALPLELEDTA